MNRLGKIFIPLAALSACLLVSCEKEKSKESAQEKERTLEKKDQDRENR